MKYMLLTYVEPDAWKNVGNDSDEKVRATYQFMGDLNRELTESGEFVSGAGLVEASKSKVVRKTVDGPTVTDGPFAEAKEVFGGFWILELESEERAVEIASRVIAFEHGHSGHTIEIRPLLDQVC